MTLTAYEIATAAKSCAPWAPGASKVYLSDLAIALGQPLSAIGAELLRLHREGAIELSCADMVAAFDPYKLRSSQLDAPVFGGYQLLVLR